jgi:CRISPR-associated protein Cas5t
MTVAALEVTITAPVVSFRNPLYASVQEGLPCPPPATVGGLLAAARGGWPYVEPTTRFAMSFQARGGGVDVETYHPLDASGKATSPTPRDRDFLADVTLTIWLTGDISGWQAALRRPVWPLRLGRSQDLIGLRMRRVHLAVGDGRQGHALLAAGRTQAGTLLQLPTAVSIDRTRTKWDTYRYARAGCHDRVEGGWVDDGGQAVALLDSTHPAQAGPRL